MIELITRIIANVVFKYVGAGLRWLFVYGGRKSFAEVFETNWNKMVGFIFFLLSTVAGLIVKQW